MSEKLWTRSETLFSRICTVCHSVSIFKFKMGVTQTQPQPKPQKGVIRVQTQNIAKFGNVKACWWELIGDDLN